MSKDLNDQLAELSRDLRDPDFMIRSQAANRLVEIANEPVMDILLDACRDESRETREIAASALSQIGDKRAIKPLLEGLMMGADWHLWNNTHLAFVHIGEPAVDALLAALQDPRFPNWDTRSFTFIQALGKIGDNRAVDPLIEMLMNPAEKLVHHAVAEALASIGDKRATEVLIWALKEYPDSYSYVSFVSALVDLIDHRTFDTFVELLDHEKELVRKRAVRGLGLLRDPRAIEILEPLCTDKSLGIREWSVRALGEIGDKQAEEILRRALEDPNKRVRKRARKALSQIGIEIDGQDNY